MYVYILFCALCYILGKATMGERENTGINNEKKLSDIMVKPSPQELTYHCPATSQCASTIFVI
jgi:hypothetical protein